MPAYAGKGSRPRRWTLSLRLNRRDFESPER